jgi:hypothetical protein
MGNAGSAPEQAKNAVDGAEAEARRAPPSTVRFVPEAAGNQAKQPPPIKLEEEGGALPPPAAEDDMAPRNLWQVRHAVTVAIPFATQTLFRCPVDSSDLRATWHHLATEYFLPHKSSPDLCCGSSILARFVLISWICIDWSFLRTHDQIVEHMLSRLCASYV